MRFRPFAALSVAAAAALVLAGCGAADPEATGAPAPTETSAGADLCAVAVPSGATTEAVVVEGEVGEPAVATFESPMEITSAERTVVVEGDGVAIADGDLVSYALSVFDPSTGELAVTEGYDSAALPVQVTIGSGADQFFGCATVGSRIVMSLPASQSSAAALWVLDVLGTSEAAAWGADQEPVAGMPTVELAEDGTPTITIPEGDAPDGVEIAALKQGDGAVVGEGDTVLVQYMGVKWSDGTEFDSSWSRGSASMFSTTGVVAGFQQALEGQTVGSQVLVVMSPEFGYGEVEGHELQTETLVFVVDILGAQSAAGQQ